MAHQKGLGILVAILVEDGFEQVEMTQPRDALEHVGAKTIIVSPRHGTVLGWNHDRPGEAFRVDVNIDDADPDDYDALLLPGGVANPDRLRVNPKAVEFVKAFGEDEKPIAAICHAPWTLIDAGLVRGKHVTSWPSLQTDLRNAGATWSDEVVVKDGLLVTSRKPDDIPAFNQAMLELFARATPQNARL